MAEKLFNVRPMFVEKVSMQTLCLLLDDVFNDRIVNDMEREHVTEENKIRADTARRLIDLVRKKGDKASNKMIAHIQRRDPELASVLGLSCDQRALPAAELKMDIKESPLPPVSMDAFWRQKQNEKNVYSGTKKAIKNRVALIITNITFTNKDFNRNGAMEDERKMEMQLKGFGYEVVKYRDLTAEAIEDAITDFSKHPKLKDTDSVVVVLMSHGKLGVIDGVNNQSEAAEHDEFRLDQIYTILGSERCPALLNKPKIIIIQACRGGQSGGVFLSDGLSDLKSDDANIQEDTVRIVHKEKDFICLSCCSPDCHGYRHTVKGSFLIQILAEVFDESAKKDDLEELFRQVMHRFEDLRISHNRQMPNKDRCSLIKLFYFYPGLALD